MKLFKYRAINDYSLNGLLKNQIFLNSYDKFNDPFEFSNPITDLSVYNARAREKLKELYKERVFNADDYAHLLRAVSEPKGKVKIERNKLVNKIKRSLSEIGIFCLSRVDNNILMWSHYSEEHKGFCIEFDGLENEIEVNCDLIETKYIDNFQDMNDPSLLIKFYVEMFSNSINMKRKKWKIKYKKLGKSIKTKEDWLLATAVMGNKYSQWSYEQEVRLVGKKLGLLEYDPKCIKSIIFGVRTSEQDKAEIQKICNTQDKKHIVFKNAVKKSNGFGIDIEKSRVQIR